MRSLSELPKASHGAAIVLSEEKTREIAAHRDGREHELFANSGRQISEVVGLAPDVAETHAHASTPKKEARTTGGLICILVVASQEWSAFKIDLVDWLSLHRQ